MTNAHNKSLHHQRTQSDIMINQKCKLSCLCSIPYRDQEKSLESALSNLEIHSLYLSSHSNAIKFGAYERYPIKFRCPNKLICFQIDKQYLHSVLCRVEIRSETIGGRFNGINSKKCEDRRRKSS